MTPRRIPLRGGGFADVPAAWARARLVDEDEARTRTHVRLAGVVLVPGVASCGGLLVHHPSVTAPSDAAAKRVLLRVAEDA